MVSALFYVAPSLDMSGGGGSGSEGYNFSMADDDVHVYPQGK